MKNIPLVQVITDPDKPGFLEFYLNEEPYHIDRIASKFEKEFDSKVNFVDYEVYKRDKLYHSGQLIVNNETDFRYLFKRLSRHKFGFLFNFLKSKKALR